MWIHYVNNAKILIFLLYLHDYAPVREDGALNE